MKRFLSVVLMLLASVLVGCTTGQADLSGPVEGATDGGGVAAITLVTPSANGAYPPGSGSIFPISPVEALLPTGYPEITVVAPSGEVSPGELSPVVPNLTPQVMPSPGRPHTAIPGLTLFTAAVVSDLSRQLSISPDGIRIVSAESVVWPNGALGCPVEGVNYAQVLIEGARITLEADGDLYSYHTDSENSFVLCRDGVPLSTGVVTPQY